MKALRICVFVFFAFFTLKADDFKLWQDLQRNLKKQADFKKTQNFKEKISIQNGAQSLATPLQSKENKALESKNVALENQNSGTNSKNKNEKQDFTQIALENYLGHLNGRNLFGISTYKMNYFIPFSYAFKGRMKDDHRAEVKFQISVKKPLFEDLLGFDETYYFAYTQTSWWQLYKYSSPFREINFAPEFFVNVPLKFDACKSLKSVRMGFLHVSNGKDDENLNSRSWNRVYVSAIFLQDKILLEPRIWYRLPESKKDDDNPRITHFMGNFDVNLAYLGKDYFASLMFRHNLNFNDNKGALEFSLAYDLFSNGVFWYVQGFSGYAERLVMYDKNTQRLSVGVLIAY